MAAISGSETSDGGSRRLRRSAITSRSRARPIWRRVAASAAIVTRPGSPTQGRKSRAIARASFSVLRTSWTRSGASSPGPGNCAAAALTDRTSAARQYCGQASARMGLGRPRVDELRPLAQGEFLHFPGRGLGNFGENDVARTFVARQARPAPFDQLIGRRAMARLHLDEGAWRFAPFLVGPRHHCGELHAGMLEQGVLDLDRRNVLAAGNDDVLRPVAQLDITVFVLDAEIARMEPA